MRLRQIVTNLVANAVKYSDSGTVELRSRLGGGNLVIEVIGQGQGLAPEDLDRVFAPFERVGATERADSTGLGLTLSRAMANAMDGELSAWSAGPGKGSTFTLTLPMASDAAGETRQAQLTGSAARGPPRWSGMDAFDWCRLCPSRPPPTVSSVDGGGEHHPFPQTSVACVRLSPSELCERWGDRGRQAAGGIVVRGVLRRH